MTPPNDDLIVGAVLFVLGALGFLTRRNLILMMLSTELMLHGVSLNLVSLSAAHGNFEGQAFTAFLLTVAACEAGLGLSLVLTLYRRRKSLDVNLWSGLSESPSESEKASAAERSATSPETIVAPQPLRLTPSGRPPLERVREYRPTQEMPRV
jgi:NADH-quinone oxidoreductase subunit K